MYKKSAGFVQIIPLLVIAIIGVSVLALSAEKLQKMNGGGAVLSESESEGKHGGDSSGSSGSDSSGSKSSGSDSSGSSSSGSSGSVTQVKASVEIKKVKTPEPKETPETEIKDQNEQNENEQELELENETEFEVREGTGEAKVKIKLGKKEDKNVVTGSKFEAQSEFPFSVDKKTNELTVTTPNGIKTVAVLPDSAVQNMLRGNVINKILNANGQNVQIKIDANGNVFYEISGTKAEKFLGVFNVEVPKTLDVSTQTGDLTNVNQTLISQILDTFSF